MLARAGALCAALAVTCVNAGQVHTALGMTDDALSVAWASLKKEGVSEVHYGTDPNHLTQVVKGDMREYKADLFRPWQTRTAVMTNLTVGQRYYYKAGDSVNGFSETFSVVNRKTKAPFNHVLFGDMGTRAAFSLCNACTESDNTCTAATCAKDTSVGLVSEVKPGNADMFLHVGDFAYNLGSDNGKNGDWFMENIEQVAARIPYMVSHGNHEDAPEALAQYIERFRSQPVNSVPATYSTLNGEAPNTMYFSWNFGLVHYVSFSTELFHLPVSIYSDKVTKDTFIKWFEEDLQKANLNREKYPWIVVHGHRPLYSSAAGSGSDETVRKALEPLFFKYGVSFSVNGHQHSYERSWPTYEGKTEKSYVNPTAPVYLVTGAAGSKEMHTPFTKDMPSWSAFRSNTFGYTRMIVHNSSHIHFQQVSTDPTSFPMSKYGAVIDDWWVVQHKQGPFQAALAPKSVPKPSGTSHDHFAPILLPRLGYPADTKVPLHTVIQEYRQKHGEVAWAQHLQYLLSRVNHPGKSGAQWEDGLLDRAEEEAFSWINRQEQ
eukprot:Rhum_TRINITY_DN14406_c0_g1::Rhum_TRINITY_DN14406_c0_g1_i1::g.87309::m.87309